MISSPTIFVTISGIAFLVREKYLKILNLKKILRGSVT
jgi:hypothetical protein